MKKLILTILCFSALCVHASKLIDAITMTKVIKGGSRTEVSTEPEVGYDGENNSAEIVIEAEQSFQMRVIDIYGTVVYTCPVMMVDGTNQELVDGLCDCLEDNYMYTASAISFFKNFTASVAETCSNLSISEINSYANDLASTIRNSNIPTDFKYEIAVTATTTINSALCWVQ